VHPVVSYQARWAVLFNNDLDADFGTRFTDASALLTSKDMPVRVSRVDYSVDGEGLELK